METARSLPSKNPGAPTKNNEERSEKYKKINELVKILKFLSLKKDIKIMQLHQKVKFLNFLSGLKNTLPVNPMNGKIFKPYIPSPHLSPARNIFKPGMLPNLGMRHPQPPNIFPGVYPPFNVLRKHNFSPSIPSKRLDIVKSELVKNHHFF